ncbi:hypothetical protein [Nocardia asiatica]|nr:hypothetical protein [Nocardia asiatica]
MSPSDTFFVVAMLICIVCMLGVIYECRRAEKAHKQLRKILERNGGKL